MRKRWAVIMCALALTAGMAAGCGNSSQKPETEVQSESKQAQTESGTEAPSEEETETQSQEETKEAAQPESQAETETEQSSENAKDTVSGDYAEPKTMYVVSDVYVRQAENADSEAVAIASLGDEITVTGETGEWYKVKLDDKEGYVSKKYVSESKEDADQAVNAEKAAQAAAQAQAAAEAQAAAQAQAAADAAAAQAAAQANSGGGKYEVSRQAYDDCDGSGHGYYEITYSDGSTAIEEY